MPQVGTVPPSYASAAMALRSIAYEIAQRTCGLSSGGCAFWTIRTRGHGSSQEYGASAFQARTFGLRCATFRYEPRFRAPIWGMSTSLFDSASAILVSAPMNWKLISFGAGDTPNTFVPHQSSRRSQVKADWVCSL